MDLEITGFFGQTVFRYANYDTPFWSRNNTSAGRWHVPGDGATQYLSLHPDAAWADLIRAENLRGEDEAELVRMRIWTVHLTQSNIVDYSTFTKAEAAGFPPDALVDDDHRRCQEHGLLLRKQGRAGVLAPSAALPGGLCVTLFGRKMKSTWGSETRLVSSIPACVVAVGGPPAGLIERVRYRGDPHVGYLAYVGQRSESAVLEDLDAAVQHAREIELDEEEIVLEPPESDATHGPD